MNKEYERLQHLIKEAEDNAINDDQCLYRNGFHIMPPTGWLNDPNGLCQIGGEYHLFFQYSPLDAKGGMKAWGHYVTKDFVTLTYLGAPFLPDEDFDKNGVYSGSSYVDENGMHIFYTGNVKLPGDHDYTYSGRRADTVLVESKDGRSFTGKKVVIDTDQYPEGYSCHIRDPKVWKENGVYYMVLGARTSDDKGRILLYRSDDMIKWSLNGEIGSNEKFGYMWECPDYFELDGSHIISFSPQGLEAEEYRFQNIYQSGYVIEDRNPVDTCNAVRSNNGGSPGQEDSAQINNNHADMIIDEGLFTEWDMGFDFYAPQTFADESGRRIIVGWAGMPDAEYTNGEVDAENWQHCFTVPRKLSVGKDSSGRRMVLQTPICEIEKLRDTNAVVTIDEASSAEYISENGLMDIICSGIDGDFSLTIADYVKFVYNDGKVSLTLSQECGRCRNIRKAEHGGINSLRILVDSSIIEYYINDGEMVFTTRFYKKDKSVKAVFEMNGADIVIYPMKKMAIESI